MRVGLHSITYLGLWHDGPGLAPLEVLRRAHHLGFDGVELDGRRPHASPIDLDQPRRRSIRETSAELDLDLVAVACNNDLSSPIVEHREAQMLMLREHIRLARDLGAPMVRVLLAWPGVTVHDGLGCTDLAQRRFDELWRESTWLEAWNRCKRCLREAVRYAEDEGVVLALQNQPPVVRDHHDVLDMIAEVDSPWLRACLDAAQLEQQDDSAVRRSVLETGALLAHTHFTGEFGRRDGGAVEPLGEGRSQAPLNYSAFVRALKEAGYDGYMCFERSRPALDARREVQGIAFIDEQAQLALEYMHALVAHNDAGGEAVAERDDRLPDTAMV